MKKDLLAKILFLRKKILGCKFFRINTSNAKNGYDLDYEVANIKAFIDEFKHKKIKELEDKINKKEEKSSKNKKSTRSQTKRTRRQNKNSTTNQITNKKLIM